MEFDRFVKTCIAHRRNNGRVKRVGRDVRQTVYVSRTSLKFEKHRHFPFGGGEIVLVAASDEQAIQS